MKGNRRNPPPAAAVNAASTVAAGSPTPAPASPTTKGTTAKYTSKDGSKFFTVPKTASPPATGTIPPSHALVDNGTPSGTMNTDAPAPAAGSPSMGGDIPTGNRKKAKRRAKAAARERGELPNGLNGVPSSSAVPGHHAPGQRPHANPLPEAREEIPDSADETESPYPDPSGHQTTSQTDQQDPPANKSKKSKKKKKKKEADSISITATAGSSSGAVSSHGHGDHDHSMSPRVSQGHGGASRQSSARERIWNTNSREERLRIKEFWLDLSEEERKSLVKVEKDTVLKKMKEQQKMTCSCHFCGRKRTAIEEELEGLYDSYYEELEQFANDPAGQHGGRGPALLSAVNRYGPSSVLHAPHTASSCTYHIPAQGRIVEHTGDDDDDRDDEPYGDEDDEDDNNLIPGDEESIDEQDIPPDDVHRDYASDFFNFGTSLQVQGDILTVADDLLKNDGRKFIEIMEKLAERRMAREEDIRDPASIRGGFPPSVNGGAYGHNHHVPSEEDDYGPEDEDDEDYESQDEDDDDEEDPMTEEQRMEEGRKMFQIFAARMFEQRVLTAYREKVAKERQQKLLEELDDEDKLKEQRKAKKAKEAQKKKDKAAQKKLALAEEKARKEAEKIAEETARREQEAAKLEEQRRKAEEKRKKKEAQRKAEEEDRLRKEADRLRRIHEQKERQAELERKAREAKELDKKLKEEARQREKEAQDKRERESRERREKQERDKREKDARSRANEALEKHKQEERATQKAAAAATAAAAAAAKPTPAVPTMRPLVSAVPTTGAAPSGPLLAAAPAPVTLPKRTTASQQQQLQPAQQSAEPTLLNGNYAAPPHGAVATPALQKIPMAMRTRQTSQHGSSVAGSQSETISRTASMSGSGHSQAASPSPMTPLQMSSNGTFARAKTPVGSTTSAFNPTSATFQTQGTQGFAGFAPTTSPLSASTSTGMHFAQQHLQQQQQQASPFAMPPTAMHYPLALGTASAGLPPGLGLSSQFTPLGGSLRASGPSPMMPTMPPGINGLGRAFAPMAPPPGLRHHLPPDVAATAPIGPPHATDSLSSGSSKPATTPHSRQPSTGGGAAGSSFDPMSSPSTAPLSVSRPAPIGHPRSSNGGGIVPHASQLGGPGSPALALTTTATTGGSNNGDDLEDLGESRHLGSRALLDDSDVALDEFPANARRVPSVPTTRMPPYGAPAPGVYGAVDLTSSFLPQSPLWGNSLPSHSLTNSFMTSGSPGRAGIGLGSVGLMNGALGGAVPGGGAGSVGNGGSGGWGMPTSAMPFSAHGGSLSRSPAKNHTVMLRQVLCQSCRELAAEAADQSASSSSPPFLPIDLVKMRVNALAQQRNMLSPVPDSDLDELYDTEGNSTNGGGNFDVERSGPNGAVRQIRWTGTVGGISTLSAMSAAAAAGGPLGSLGSPVPPSASSMHPLQAHFLPPGTNGSNAIGSTSSGFRFGADSGRMGRMSMDTALSSSATSPYQT